VMLTLDSFKQFFKTILFSLTSVTSALEVIFNVMRSINPRFTCLLTYFYLLFTQPLLQSCRQSQIGDRSFTAVGPRLCNNM